MSYRIHFVGLACFIKQTDGSYLVALPDGTRGNYPPCAMNVHTHRPYVIVPQRGVSGAAFMPIELHPGSTVEFRDALSGLMNDSHLQQNGLHWREVDPAFSLDKLHPRHCMTTIRIASGTFETTVVPGVENPAIMTTVRIDGDANSVWIDHQEYEFTEGDEVIVANVAPEWIHNHAYPDSSEHFFIYYTMYNGPGAPACKTPHSKQLAVTDSKHPYLVRSGPSVEGLHVDCSNTVYP